MAPPESARDARHRSRARPTGCSSMPASRCATRPHSSPTLPAWASVMSIARRISGRARAACTATTWSITTHSIPRSATAPISSDFIATLRAHGMGHILDIVPNHVGVMGSDNAWWMDVLENGPASALRARSLTSTGSRRTRRSPASSWCRCSGSPTGSVLERGELEPRFERDARRIRHLLPRAPLSARPAQLPADSRSRAAPARARDALPPEARAEFESLIAAFGHLPATGTSPDAKPPNSNRDKEVHKRHLAAMCAAHPQHRRRRSTRELAEPASDPGTGAARTAMRCTSCSTPRPIGSPPGASPRMRSTTGASSTSTILRRCAWRTRRCSRATHRFALELLQHGQARRPAHRSSGWALRPRAVFPPPASRAGEVRRRPRTGPLPLYLVVEKITAALRASARHLARARHDAATTSRIVVNGLFVDAAARCASRAHLPCDSLASSTEWTRDRLRRQAPDSRHRALLRAHGAHQPARAHRARRSQHPRLHFPQPAPGARGHHRLLSRSTARMLQIRCRSRIGASSTGRWRAPRARDSGINFELFDFIRTTLLLESAAAIRARTRARLRDEIPAADRAGDGEGRRGHRALPLPSPGVAQRGRRRPRHVWRQRACVPCGCEVPPEALAARNARDLDPRHQALGGHARAHRCALGDAGRCGARCWRAGGA